MIDRETTYVYRDGKYDFDPTKFEDDNYQEDFFEVKIEIKVSSKARVEEALRTLVELSAAAQNEIERG